MNDVFAQEEVQIKTRMQQLTEELRRLNERQILLQRYRELIATESATEATEATESVTGTTGTTANGNVLTAPRRRGRPKGAKNKPKEVVEGDDKSIDLPTLLETISQQVSRPLTCADFVTLVRESGYKTKAKDFSNMIYQALLKLIKRGKFKKNEETRAYEFVKNAA